jgi:hypothetical protein
MPSGTQTRAARVRSQKFEENVTKRGNVTSVKDTGTTVGGVVLAFLVFVVVGSAILQIVRGNG